MIILIFKSNIQNILTFKRSKLCFGKDHSKEKWGLANRVFTATIEKLRGIQADMTVQIDKNQAKMQKLSDDNTELEAMKHKAARQIEEISKFIA